MTEAPSSEREQHVNRYIYLLSSETLVDFVTLPKLILQYLSFLPSFLHTHIVSYDEMRTVIIWTTHIQLWVIVNKNSDFPFPASLILQ